MTPISIRLAVALSALALVACGSDSGGSGTPATGDTVSTTDTASGADVAACTPQGLKGGDSTLVFTPTGANVCDQSPVLDKTTILGGWSEQYGKVGSLKATLKGKDAACMLLFDISVYEPIAVGKVYPVKPAGSGTSAAIVTLQDLTGFEAKPMKIRSWVATEGTLKVDSITGNKVVFSLDAPTLTPTPGTSSITCDAQGSWSIKGALTVDSFDCP